MPARALYITQDITFVHGHKGGAAYETPDTATDAYPAGDLAVLLDRLATAAARAGLHEMSVYLDPHAAAAHGFPVKLPASETRCAQHPTMLRARDHGWSVARVRRWMTFQKEGKPVVHVGLAQWMSRGENPLWDNDPGAAAYLLYRFQDISGHAYHAKPSVMGTIMLKALYTNNSVTWKPENWEVFKQVTRTEYNHVNPALISQAVTLGHVHAYDTTRAYLAAAGACDLARTSLRHTGRTQAFNKAIAGLWKVVVPTWNEPRLPHPMGSNRTPGDEVWLTTPTLALVAEIAQDKRGLIDVPRILDSYTAPPRTNGNGKTIPSTARVLREWAAYLDTCVLTVLAEETGIEREKLEEAFKGCYRESVNGHWKNDSSHITRQDWFYSVDALAGANAYRKVWYTGNTEQRFPIYQGNVDAICYASAQADPKNDRLKRFVVGDTLGSFDVESFTAEAWRKEAKL